MKTAKIYMNGRFLTQPVTGVQRYARELVKSLDRLIESGDPELRDISFELLAPQGELLDPLKLRHIAIRQSGPFGGHLWEQLTLPFLSSDGALLSPCNTGPILKREHTIMLHDAAVYESPETYSWAFRTWYRVLFKLLGKNAKRILTCSKFSQEQLVRYVGIKPAKIRTIYHGKEHILNFTPDNGILAKQGLNRPFVLAVSSMSPNKNFGAVVEAMSYIENADYDFVIAGGSNAIFNSSVDTAKWGDRVKLLGYVSDEELRALYDQAACFVFPSFYEGFGFPALEAMACGCPVVASKAASIPEVCGDAALYFDPHKPREIAEQIRRLMADPELRKRMSAAGAARSDSFSWDKCAKETLHAIQGRNDRQAGFIYLGESGKGLIG